MLYAIFLEAVITVLIENIQVQCTIASVKMSFHVVNI
jgi:hypothetical protein